jgi:hypothetical protein
MIYKVNSVEEAISLANSFKSENKYDLFRGQSRDWEAISTIQRLTDETKREKIQKFNRLYDYFKNNELLKYYVKNGLTPEFFAIAQHYELPTNYIDFTSDPSVAAFFATTSPYSRIDDECVIICLNIDDFNSFNNQLETSIKYFSKRNLEIPQIVNVELTNLWRLKAQQGCFMHLNFQGYDIHINRFHRIYFPYKGPLKSIISTQIYPVRKSPIELELDKFFMNEIMILNDEIVQSSYDVIINASEPPENEYNYIFNDYLNIPIDQSWLNIGSRWHNNNSITYLNDIEINTIEIDLSQTLNGFRNFINYFNESLIDHENILLVKINIENSSVNLDIEKLNNLKKYTEKIWDGMRALPYSVDDIGTALYNYYFLEINEIDINNMYKFEFGESLNGQGYYSRTCLMFGELGNCLRSDIVKYINSQTLYELAENWEIDISQKPREVIGHAIMQLPIDIRLISDYNKFLEFFIINTIPMQAYLKRETILYNPSLIKRFGLA